MAVSELSADLSSLEVNGSEGHDGMNVDEVLEDAVGEAANSQTFNEERREYLHTRKYGECSRRRVLLVLKSRDR